MPKKSEYAEDKDFVNNPTDQFGTLDTSGTAGSAHSRIEEVSPVFAVADQQNALNAARAIDPNDDGVSSSAVVLPDDKGRSREEALKSVKDRAAKAKKDGDLSSGRVTPAQEEAAESGDKAGDKADNEQKSHGATGTPTSTTGPGTAKKTEAKPAKA